MKDVFKKGHYYKFKDDRAFYVLDICECDRCKERGLFEPKVIWLNDCYSGWNADYISSISYYTSLSNNIEIESDHKEKWVEDYIQNTIEKRKKELEVDIEKYLSSWQ
jgi:hypothetical protein